MLSSPDWPWWLATALLSVGALALLAFALLHDRARGRKRCPRCWYPMDAVTGLQCPECGHTARSPRRLLRTRRRWRLAALALAIASMAYATSLAPKVRRDGWPSIVPSTALVTIWPVPVEEWIARHIDGVSSSDPAVEELDHRLDAKRLSRWQTGRWLSRVEAELRRTGRLYSDEERAVVSRLTRARITRTWKNATLETVLADLEHDLNVPVRADWDALQPGPGKDTTLSLELTRASGEEAICEVLLATGWDYVSFGDWYAIREGVLITSSAGPAMPPRVGLFDVSELFSRMRKAAPTHSTPTDAPYAEVLQRLCSRWLLQRDLLGRNSNFTVSIIGHVLIVNAGATDLHRIESLLDALAHSFEDHAPRVVAIDPHEWDEALAVADILKHTPVPLASGSMELSQLVSMVHETTGLPIACRWMLPSTIVRLPASPSSSYEILDACFPDGEGWNIEHGAISIKRDSDEWRAPHTRLYALGDLYALDTAATLADMYSVHRLIISLHRGLPADTNILGLSDLAHLFGARVFIRASAPTHLRIEAAINARLEQAKPVNENPATSP